MSLEFKIIQLAEVEEIIKYEKSKLSETTSDPMEQEIASWNSRWRKESLEHYLPLGWSFWAKDQHKNIAGYFIAQPLLFFDGFTQALWVEHLQFSTSDACNELCILAVKLAKEKHFQKCYLPKNNAIESAVEIFKPKPWNADMIQIQTTRM